VTVVRWVIAAVGVLVAAIGVVFIGQGLNAIKGSSMTGHTGYAWLGAVLVVIGVGLVVIAWRFSGAESR
jgi:uncharacterized membrane protein YidH (DUF202 family)